MTRPTTSKLLQGQHEYLESRIRNLKYPDPEKPPEVVAAEILIQKWEKKSSAEYDKVAATFRKLRDEARRAIYFSTPEEALEIVEALAKKYGESL